MLRRLLASTIACTFVLPVVLVAVLVVPVVTTGSTPTSHVVAGHVREIPLTMGPRGAESPQLVHVGTFSMVGVTWIADGTASPVTARVRVHTATGWSRWEGLGDGDTMPDEDHLAGRRLGTEPLWTGPADGVQVTVQRRDGGRPQGLRLSLIDPGHEASDGVVAQRPASSAEADTGMPPVVTRRQWGAAEKYATWKPEYADSITGVVIHHTDSSNSYTRAQAAQQVRAIFSYHARSLGWGDIGYHYLVDRFGTIYEGRKGGMGSTVVGGHTYGFNHGSIGISLLGNYDSVKPSAAQMESVARITAWVMAQAHRNPTSTATYTVDQAKNPRYRKGRVVTVKAIVGHRDLYPTDCPGRQAYALLPALRKRVDQLLGPELANPTVTTSGAVVTVSAGLRKATTWSAQASGPAGVVHRWSGVGATASVPWSLDGLVSGTYTLALSASGAQGVSATPVVVTAVVTSTTSPRLVLPTGLTARADDGTFWRVDDGAAPGAQVRRLVAPWVLASMGDLSSRLASHVDDVLMALPVGPPLPARDGTLLDVGGVPELLSGGVLHPFTPLVSQPYPSSAAISVTAADVADLPGGAAVPSSGPHLSGTVLRAADGSLSVLVTKADGTLVRRRVVSPAALATWSSPAAAVAPTSADDALPWDVWDRGLADGVVVSGVTGTSIVSRGQGRLLTPDALARYGIPPTGSDADLGHAEGLVAVPGVPLVSIPVLAQARAVLAGVRKPTWRTSWSTSVVTGADVAPAPSDPARP